MIRLLGAEATRLLSRRFTGLALLVLLLGLSGYQFVVNESLSPLTGEQLATAEQAYQQSHEDWVDNHDKYEQQCRDSGGTAADCTAPEPTLNDFSVEPAPFKQAAGTALELSTVFVSLAAFMIAASFIGAEYNSGSISNWLTFVPRRAPVFWSKLLTMIGFAALLGACAAVLVLAAAVVLARFHNSAARRAPTIAAKFAAPCRGEGRGHAFSSPNDNEVGGPKARSARNERQRVEQSNTVG